MNYDTETWPVLFECMSGSGWISGDEQKKKKTVSRQDTEIQAMFWKHWGKTTSLKIHCHTQEKSWTGTILTTQ